MLAVTCEIPHCAQNDRVNLSHLHLNRALTLSFGSEYQSNVKTSLATPKNKVNVSFKKIASINKALF